MEAVGKILIKNKFCSVSSNSSTLESTFAEAQPGQIGPKRKIQEQSVAISTHSTSQLLDDVTILKNCWLKKVVRLNTTYVVWFRGT